MTLTLHTSQASLAEQLAVPPETSLQIRGVHTTSSQVELVDFDLWINCSKGAEIRSGQFLTRSEQDYRSWSQDASQDSRSFQTILHGWLNDWLGNDTGDERSWTLCKLVPLPDDDCAAIKAHIEHLARKAAYGGSVRVIFHTPDVKEDAFPDGQNAEIRVEWSFDHLFNTPAGQSWDQLVMNAMVDRRKGWISLDDPKPSHGMSPFRRAIRSGNTSRVVSQEQGADGFKHSVRQYSRWGTNG